MEDTIKVGDKILLSKLSYGPRLWFSNGKRSRENTYRLKGLGSVSKGDIVVFDHPIENKEYIKRCMGVPGDTVFLLGDELVQRINGESIPNLLKNIYLLKTNDLNAFHLFLSKHGLSPFEYAVSRVDKSIRISLNTYQFLELSETDYIQEIFLDTQNDDDSLNKVDALVIPYKGMTLTSDMVHIDYYLKLINTFEGEGLDVESAPGYRFKSDYFYFLGDNRPVSSDSRSFGLVPDHAIIGKSRMVLFSFGKNGMNWSRLLRFIQ